MKRIGSNYEVVVTENAVKYWLTHQQSQRKPIARHIHALAKLFARTGWRNDQRICVDYENRLINGLQRLSAIDYMKDYGWKIPVTKFSKEELTNDIIESFNVQKNDSPTRLMCRLYGWKDKRMTTVANGIYRCLNFKQNPTTNDLFDIYEHTKDVFDEILSVKESHDKDSKKMSQEMMVAGVCLILSGIPSEKYISVANKYVGHDESGPVWKALRDWCAYWHSLTQSNGNALVDEPYDFANRVAIRFNVLRQFAMGKRISKIQNISVDERAEICEECRLMLKTKTEF